MKVAVTGATGFVGQHVLRALAARAGVHVVASSRHVPAASMLPPGVRHVAMDLAEPSADDFDRLGRPDVLLHLAWTGLPNYRSLHHFETELPRQYAFLRSMVMAGLPSLFVAGTCYEYGMSSGEMQESLTSPPTNPYAYAKTALLRQLQFLRAASHFQLTWARLFYMYGQGQAGTSLYAQLMAAIQHKDASFKMSGGEQLRDFLPIAEVARQMVDLGLQHPDAGVVNVCSGRPTSVRSLVERILAEHGSNMVLDLGRFPYPDFEPMAFWGSRTKIDHLLGTGSTGIQGLELG